MKKQIWTCLAALVTVSAGASHLAASPSTDEFGCSLSQIGVIALVSDALCPGGGTISDISCSEDEVSWTLTC